MKPLGATVFRLKTSAAAYWLCVLLFSSVHGAAAVACPFCIAIEPTLAQRREDALAVVLAEAGQRSADGKSQTFRLHKVFKGPPELKKRKSLDAAPLAAKAGTLAILFATADDEHADLDHWEWSAVVANEALLGYFAAAPDWRQPPAKRLGYFVGYLEHADRDIARDAYLEFAHASYDEVLTVADKFDFADLRRWLQSPAVPDERKGFYGVSLGMATRPKDRATNRALLERLIHEDRSDFRAGFDGWLAGYLLLSGPDGLKSIESRYLNNDKAKEGDVRHAANALRFYHEYGPQELRGNVAAAVAKLISRPQLAATAVTDLARWEHWTALDQVAALYDRPGFSDSPTRRAIVGYLKACPKREAPGALEGLRRRDPAGVEAAESALLLRTSK